LHNKIVSLFDIKINNIKLNEVLEHIEKIVTDLTPSYFVTPNVDHIVQLQYDKEFKKIYNNASMILADGMPLIWTSILMKRRLVERVTGADLLPKILGLAKRKGYRVFILGTSPDVAKKVIDKTLINASNDIFIDSYSPSFGFEKDVKELQTIERKIKGFEPDILLVSLGSPKGEKWIYNNYVNLNVPFSISIGAAIDFYAGSKKRAPMWMRNSGLEWFYRFLQEPKRMFKRYFVRDSKFFIILLNEFRRKKE
jgi:N-acetylglucosaminyldiphosphoundecaprenol N-acetyl-beta-D-mannosaminyltransferase